MALMLVPDAPAPGFGWKDAISLLALGVSLLTAYLSFFRKARLHVRLGKVILIQYSQDASVSLNPEISVLSEGATVAVVHHIDAHLRRLADDSREQLNWIENLTTEFDDDTRGTDTHFHSFPETLFVSKSAPVNRRLLLRSVHPVQLQQGDYELLVTVNSDGTTNPFTTAKRIIRLQTPDINYLERSRPDLGTKKSLNLRLQFEQGPNTNCYIGKPPRDFAGKRILDSVEDASKSPQVTTGKTQS